MYLPNGAQPIPLSAVTPLWASQFSLPCDDSEQNPQYGRRGVNLAFNLNYNNANVYPSYFVVDLTPYVSSGFLDKILSVEFNDLAPVMNQSIPSATNLLGAMLGCDGTNQFVSLANSTNGYSIIKDVLAPSPKFYLFTNPLADGAQIDAYFSLIFCNFSRRLACTRP